MPLFDARVEFRFEAESLEAGKRAIRRLTEAARAVGFDVIRGQVEPAAENDASSSGWTSYGPRVPPPG